MVTDSNRLHQQERRPELTIIAGPNGAGKSRLCPLYVSAPSFNGDKLFENLTFIDGSTEYGEIVAMHNTKGNIHKVEDNPPQWFKEQFEEEFAKLANTK